MSLSVINEGTIRIRRVSDKNCPSFSLRAANGTFYKLLWGTMMTHGSTRKSATGKIRSLELKERLDWKSKITSSSPSLRSHRSVRLSSSSGLCCDLMTRGKERSSHSHLDCMPRHRKLLIKNNSNYCLIACQEFPHPLSFFWNGFLHSF